MNLLRLGQSACVVLFLFGCSAFYMEKFEEPELDLRKKKVLVVPFRMGNLWYYESPEGSEFARSVVVALQESCPKFVTADESKVEQTINEILDDDLPWAEIGRAVEAEYVIYGDIEKLSYTRPRMVGMLQGELVVNYHAWDVINDEPALARQITLKYPGSPDEGEIFVDFEENRDEFRARLFGKAAKKIRRIFCGEMVEIR